MVGLTRNGIAYNLNFSPYIHTEKYSDETIQYVFSSKMYLDKFLMNYEFNRVVIHNRLFNQFKFDIDSNKIADIKLYADIEKRGFMINVADKNDYEGGKILCQDNLILDGLKLRNRNWRNRY